MRWSWRQWIWFSAWTMLICVGCDGRLLATGDAPAAGSNGSDQTAEVVALRSVGLVPSVPISVEVHNGDISVVALRATTFFSGAIFIEDDIVFTSDITETLEITNKAEVVKAEASDGIKGPRAITHLRVPENVALNLHTRKGAIFVSGVLGDITAVADDGRIEVRGQTGALTLKSKGDSGIVVDGETGSLILTSGNGPIEITMGTAAPLVSVSTGAGQVFFSGKLAEGNNYFTATAAGQITVMMPRDLKFDLNARTVKSAITVQYPTTPNKTFVCATMDVGWPVDARVDSTHNKPRAQITVKPASNQITVPVVLTGTIGQLDGIGYLMFHTTMHSFSALVPDLSDLSLDQVDYSTGATVGQNFQDVTDPSALAAFESFTGQSGQVATAIPLNAEAANVPANQSPPSRNLTVLPSGAAIPMKGHNCLLDIAPSASVRVYLTSAGGQIRILQMSPGK